MIYLPEHTASSQSRRICWYRWWRCSQWSGCSCRVLMFRSPAKRRKSSTFLLEFHHSSLLRLTHLPDAELVQAFIMSKNCNLIGHSSTYAGPVVNLWRKVHWRQNQGHGRYSELSLPKKNLTNLPRGEEVASLDRFKDERAEVRGSWEVRLWQRLLHLLDLHETQGPVLPWGTTQQHQKQESLTDHRSFSSTLGV